MKEKFDVEKNNGCMVIDKHPYLFFFNRLDRRTIPSDLFVYEVKHRSPYRADYAKDKVICKFMGTIVGYHELATTNGKFQCKIDSSFEDVAEELLNHLCYCVDNDEITPKEYIDGIYEIGKQYINRDLDGFFLDIMPYKLVDGIPNDYKFLFKEFVVPGY